ncbi:MAG: 2-amino-4-hydroxy-6-hydroxymethyldihydropteridine diphosphokinase [Acidiferrobacterales bacterium]
MSPADLACAYVGLGSNLYGPAAQVRTAIGLLGDLPETRVERCSGLYRSSPVGITSQPDFINAVCQLSTRLEAPVLMRHLLALEAGRGRVRAEAGGPRILDLDLLLYIGPDGVQQVSGSAEVVLPHPRLHERAFVLYPLHEIAPALEIAGQGGVGDLMAKCIGQTIERLADAAAGREDAGTFERSS